jgi:hypothetical protein
MGRKEPAHGRLAGTIETAYVDRAGRPCRASFGQAILLGGGMTITW